jgi:hypothetical protein
MTDEEIRAAMERPLTVEDHIAALFVLFDMIVDDIAPRGSAPVRRGRRLLEQAAAALREHMTYSDVRSGRIEHISEGLSELVGDGEP